MEIANSKRYILLFLNLIFYRFDAFMSNMIDFLIIMTFVISINMKLTNIANLQSIYPLIFFGVILHGLYSPVYIINDIIDYDRVIKFKPQLFEFYKWRPTVYFNKSKKIIVIYSVVFFSVFVFLAYILLFYSIPLFLFFFICSVIALSFGYSSSKNVVKLLFFSGLRLVKYGFWLISISLFIISSLDVQTTILLFLILILPLTIINIGIHAKTRGMLKRSMFNSSKVRVMIVGLSTILLVILVTLAACTILTEIPSIDISRILVTEFVILCPTLILRWIPLPIVTDKFNYYLIDMGLRLMIIIVVLTFIILVIR